MRGMKKLAAVVIALVAVIAVAGTSIPVEAAAKAPKKITLKTTSKTVDIKGKATVSVKSVSPKGASKAVKYTSSNKKVATVSSKGVVTGKKAGKVTITATSKKSKKVKKTIKITVKQLKPTQISLSSKAAMKTGDKKALKATVKPAGVYCPLSWSSGNKSVATVDKKGNVTAKAPGTAVITVKSKEKNKKGKYLTKKCTVTVTAKEIKVSALTFADKGKTLTGLGTTYTNKLTIAPANATNKKVTYSSSDPKIAAVDSASGKVTTVAAGNAVITASAADGSGKKASYKLTVADRMNANIDWQYVESADLIANKEDYVIIDLRPTKALDSSIGDNGYEQGHIEGSVWVPAWPVNSADKENLLRASYVLEQLKDNDKNIAFICQSGAGGAKRAISVMADAGIDLSRMYIQKGGGKDLLANHGEELEKGVEAFTGDLVISAAELKQELASKTPILVDTRGIDASKETAKGAITISWPMISNMPGAGKAGHARPLDAAKISEKLGSLGLGADDQIVLFSADYVSGGWGDDGRIAWQLLQCGYKNVKIVDGGLSAMKAVGIATQKGSSPAKAKPVTVTSVDTTSHDITTEALLQNFADYTVIDVRANDEYEGGVLYGEASGGHIKGAKHIRFTDLFRYDGSLKSNTELTQLFENAGIKKTDKVVTYCTGGIRSAYMQLVLQMLGYENSYNYAESAYRWSNTADAGTTNYWDSADSIHTINFEEAEIKVDNAGLRLTAVGAIAKTNPLKSAAGTLPKVTYSSSDEKIAKVSARGVVTVVVADNKYGEVTISANTEKGTASYKVLVEDRQKDPIEWQSKSSAEVITAAKAGEMIVLDTRPESFGSTPELGYAAGHIPGSVWVPSWPVNKKTQEDALREKAENLKDDTRPIAIICRSGQGGAKRAISVLIESGIAKERLFIQSGGGSDLIKNHAPELEVGIPATDAQVTGYMNDSDPNTVLVDARLADAYQGWALDGAEKGGHLKNSVNISAQWLDCEWWSDKKENKTLEESIQKELDANAMTAEKSYIIYDTNGKDAKKLAEYLGKKGYNNISLYNAANMINFSDAELISYPNYDLYVPAEVVKNISDHIVNGTQLGELAQSIVKESPIVLLDVSWGDETNDPNTGSGYVDGHIPGAVHINTDEYESPKVYVPEKDEKYRNEWRLNKDEELIQLAGDKGVTKDSCVIIVGHEPMATTRMALILKYLGCENVHVMSEGEVGWKAKGYSMATGIVNPTPVSFGVDTPKNPDIIDTISEVVELKKNSGFLLIDARTSEEYNGTSSGYSYHDLMGRIDGAILSEPGIGYSSSMYYYRNPDKSMRSKEILEGMWKSQEIDTSKHMSFFCGSGWRAAEIVWDAWVLGYDASLYSDGWIGWSNDGHPFIDKDGQTVWYDKSQNKVVPYQEEAEF